jgi:hypothetical protein
MKQIKKTDYPKRKQNQNRNRPVRRPRTWWMDQVRGTWKDGIKHRQTKNNGVNKNGNFYLTVDHHNKIWEKKENGKRKHNNV